MKNVESTLQTLSGWMAGASETLAIILNQGVYPQVASHQMVSQEELSAKCCGGVAFSITLSEGLEGEFQLLLSQADADTLIDLLVGGAGVDTEEPTRLHQTVLQEAILQLIPGLADQLTRLRGQAVEVRLSEASGQPVVFGRAERYLWWECPFTLEETARFRFVVLGPESLMEQFGPSPPPAVVGQSQNSATPTKPSSTEADASTCERFGRPRFAELGPAGGTNPAGQLDLILEVPLQVQVVLGRTSMLVQDLIHLGEGSILELDKLAGEPVELYVNDRLVAFAEVIVVDERFGVKVLELASEKRQLKPAASF